MNDYEKMLRHRMRFIPHLMKSGELELLAIIDRERAARKRLRSFVQDVASLSGCPQSRSIARDTLMEDEADEAGGGT